MAILETTEIISNEFSVEECTALKETLQELPEYNLALKDRFGIVDLWKIRRKSRHISIFWNRL